MGPAHAGVSGQRRTVQRVYDWSVSVALGVSLLLGAVLGQSTLATAQPASPGADPSFFPATGYRIGSPAVLDYFQHRGGIRTFGYPVSSEFPLLGQRVQLFQRQMLEITPDGTVTPTNILDPDILPITRIDGLSLPAADPDLLGSAPTPGSPDYAVQALAFVNLYVPDDWNGVPVNFQSTFLGTVTCADASGTDPCDQSALPALDLEVWGLPTSLPTSDPLNPDFIYQRFQRGIMHFSRATNSTQGLLLGDWLKRIMVGVDLSPDIDAAVRHSRFFAQYAPSRPLALDRPADLPDSSLAQAFRADTLAAAGQGLAQAEPTLPTNVAQTATAVVLTATAVAAQATATGTPGAAVSSVPVDPSGCRGDEQMWFVPRKPNTGVHVNVSVTSQRHHDVRAMILSGPIDPGPVTERTGPLGFVWTWTIVPTVEGFYSWTFFADGLRPCNTSGFNAFAPLGATATPTLTPVATNTPGATATPTSTVVPLPVISSATSSGTCNSLVSINGTGFGSPPSSVGTNIQLIAGPANSGTPKLLNLIGGSNTQLTATMPNNLVIGQGYFLVVSNNGGA